jgi:hypothetical protein
MSLRIFDGAEDYAGHGMGLVVMFCSRSLHPPDCILPTLSCSQVIFTLADGSKTTLFRGMYVQ